MHNNERDIIDRIDELTEPGPDAMRWTPAQDTTGEDGSFGAILIRDRAELVTLHPDVNNQVRDLVGDPNVDHFEPVTGLDFWFGDESRFTNGPNIRATQFLRMLIEAVVVGDYTASDADRGRAVELLATPLVIHGPCLIAGVTEADPGPLPEVFLSWGTRIENDRTERLIELLAAALADYAHPPRDHQ